ncbi:MAG: pilus assembly PilX N-terminal domain-containing protein [Proteobacteria bacterium]|nr:pilus assembly PilX N-terminal domain-containing protein [Pseudomonadota bacterium]
MRGGVRRREAGEAGSALVLAVMITLLLVGLGLSAMWLGSQSAHVTGSMARRQEAMYAAEAGIERARAVLAASTAWDNLLGGTTGGSCGATLDDPTGKGNVLCDGATPMEHAMPAATQTAALAPVVSAARYTLFVRNDPAEAAQPGGRFDDTDRRVIVRSEGRGADGVSVVTIEAMLLVGGGGGPGSVPDYSQAGLNSGGSNSGQTTIAGP